ncbi:unnamed protein product [Ixodes hexagonus]
MALEKDFPPRRPSPTRSVGIGRSSAGSSQTSVCEDTETLLNGGGVAVAGPRSPSYQRQRSPNRSVRRKPRSSPRRYHGSHSNGCASATASPQRDVAAASTCVNRSQSMRTARRPQNLHNHFRQRIASIPGDMLAAQHQDGLGAGCNDSRGSSNNSLPAGDEAGDVLRLRNFAVTSKGIVNRGDSFRSKSRSTHSVSSTGSGNNNYKLAVPSAAATSADIVSDKFYICASLDGDGRVVSSLQQQMCQSAPWPAEAGLARNDRTSLRVDCHEPTTALGSLPPELLVTKTVDSALARYRVLVLGASQVGKTSLTNQFMTSEYICSYDSSVGKRPSPVIS